MPPEADLIRIRHMAAAAREAIGFVAGHSRSDLDTNRMLARAVVKAIEIVGEAATKVSAEARGALPDVPWAELISMRHRLIHTYFDINLDIVWDTVQVDLPPLAAALETWLPKQVVVVLNDNGGLNSAANPWLIGVRLPCKLQGLGNLAFTVEATFADRNDMFRVSPTMLVIARRTGFTGDHLSNETPVRFLATLV